MHNIDARLTVARLLSLSGDAFIRGSYLSILRREPDLDGMRHYLARLSAGYSKESVLHDLMSSGEAKSMERWEDLASLPEDAFVDGLCVRLLGRSPDPHTKRRYIEGLRSHGNHGRIYAEIAELEEAQAYRRVCAMLVEKITSHLQEVRETRLSLWGRLVTPKALLRRLRKIETALDVIAADIRRLADGQVQAPESIDRSGAAVAELGNGGDACADASFEAQSDVGGAVQLTREADGGSSTNIGPANGVVTVTDRGVVFQVGERRRLRVEIRNHSSVLWESTTNNPLSLSYHWRHENGETYLFDGLRTRLSRSIAQGEAGAMTLNIAAPTEPGRYLLEVTLVLDGHYWLEQRGLCTQQLPMQVNLRKLSRRANEIYEDLRAQLAGGPLGCP